MIAFIGFFLFEGAAALLAAGCCWLSLKFGRLPSWSLALFVSIAIAGAVVLYADGGYLIHPDRDEYAKTSAIGVLSIFLVLWGLAILPDLMVVHYYRKRFGGRLDSAGHR
jgi:hypothetical protein